MTVICVICSVNWREQRFRRYFQPKTGSNYIRPRSSRGAYHLLCQQQLEIAWKAPSLLLILKWPQAQRKMLIRDLLQLVSCLTLVNLMLQQLRAMVSTTQPRMPVPSQSLDSQNLTKMKNQSSHIHSVISIHLMSPRCSTRKIGLKESQIINTITQQARLSNKNLNNIGSMRKTKSSQTRGETKSNEKPWRNGDKLGDEWNQRLQGRKSISM